MNPLHAAAAAAVKELFQLDLQCYPCFCLKQSPPSWRLNDNGVHVVHTSHNRTHDPGRMFQLRLSIIPSGTTA